MEGPGGRGAKANTTTATDDGERVARTAAMLSEMNGPGWSVRGYTLNGYSKYISQEPLE